MISRSSRGRSSSGNGFEDIYSSGLSCFSGLVVSLADVVVAPASCLSSFWEMYSAVEINSSVGITSSNDLMDVKLVISKSLGS